MPHHYKVSKKTKKLLFSLLITLLAVIASGFIDVDIEQSNIAAPAQPGFYRVITVQDGDTVTVNMDGREEKIRFIGVDTPETIKPNSPQECYGMAASDYLKNLLSGQEVKLVADPINQNRDRYDRLLRYVYFEDKNINQEIIAGGYGFAYLSFPFTKSEEFHQAQLEARKAGKGVWGSNCEIKNPDSERPKTNELT